MLAALVCANRGSAVTDQSSNGAATSMMPIPSEA